MARAAVAADLEAAPEELGTAGVRSWLFLLTIGLASLPGPLNFTMLVVALPHIADDFGISDGAASLLLVIPMIASSSLQSIGGRLGDVLGYRRVFFGSMVGFAIVSVAATLAPSFIVLVAMRVLLTTFNSTTQPNGFALVRVHLPAARRANSYGILMGSFALAMTAGPLLGGVIVSTVSWRGVLAAGVPLSLAAMALTATAIPADEPRGARARHGFDVLGAVLLAASIAALVVPLTLLRGDVLAPIWLPVAWLPMLALLVLFTVWELRQREPLIQVRLFREPTFRAAALSESFVNVSFFPITVVATIFLQSFQDRSATLTGAVIAAGTVPMIVTSPLGGRLADRYGRRLPALAGRGLLIAGLLPVLWLNADAPPWLLVLAIGIMSVGGGIAFAAVQSAAIEAAPRRYSGMAAGVFNTTSFIGGIIGVSGAAVYLGGDDATIDDFRLVFLIFLATALVGLALTTRLRDWPAAEEDADITRSAARAT